jgi:1-deoxy-D-xylulose-5-phosphate reductoisomerase
VSRPSISILGATGSIGTSTLDVLARHPELYRVHALTGYRRLEVLAEQCAVHRPTRAVVPDATAAKELRRLVGHLSIDISHGTAALEEVAGEADVVMAAIVGAAGLPAALAAARAGRRILLANKEALVMAGQIMMDLVARHNAELLPIDSEHNALFQSLPRGRDTSVSGDGIAKLILTASGGPFRQMSLERMARVTPDEACAHPNWVMGRKISVDSATLMNKGLEVIEARWLFGVDPDRIEVVIHPQSVIHSMVSYVDGSVLAQMGNPDMRTPIAHALAYPQRMDAGVAPLDLTRIAELRFEAPDFTRFPCLALANQAMRAPASAPAVLNAANEIAVQAFLDGRIGFLTIASVVEDTLASIPGEALSSLDHLMGIDQAARRRASQSVEQRS